MARKKRAEFARAQAQENGEADGVGALTASLSAAAIGDDEDVPKEKQVEDPEHLIGFARLYSGTLSIGFFLWGAGGFFARIIRGYALKTKRWLEFFVGDVGEINFNEQAFDSLVLQRALVQKCTQTLASETILS